MPRLIDAEKMPHGKLWDELSDIEKANVLAYLASSPTVDAVEVVRCRDCKYFNKYHNCMLHSIEADAYNSGHYVDMKPDDFCSYGERKDGDE